MFLRSENICFRNIVDEPHTGAKVKKKLSFIPFAIFV